MAGKSGYHHGNLRAALLQAALVILEKEGPQGLSLRHVAARAKVSHAAPAHHFPSLRSLLTALAAIAFRRFAGAVQSERDRAESDPASQVRAATGGYLAFASDNPGLFRLMFSEERLDWSDPELREAADAAFMQLAGITGPFADILGLKDEAGRMELEKLLWSAAHGYAHLLVDGKMGRYGGRSPPPDLVGLLLRGPARSPSAMPRTTRRGKGKKAPDGL